MRQSTKITKSLLDVQKSTKPWHQSTTQLSHKSLMEQQTSKGGMAVSPMHPDDKLNAHREVVYRDTDWEVDREVIWEVVRSSHTEKSRARGIHSTETCTMKSSEMSTEKSTNKVYQVNQHLDVIVTYQWLPLDIYSTKYCTKAQESAGTLRFGKHNHLYWSSLDRCRLIRSNNAWCNWPLQSMITEGADRCR